MRKTLRQIITTVLAAFIILTGNTITAEAKVVNYQKDRTGMEDARELNGTTVTMKVGDTKKVDLIEESDDYSIDSTKRYAWASSDETIVSMQRAWDISTAETYEVSHVIIKAEKPGTATITATESKEKNDYKYYFVYVCGICGEEFSPLEYGSDEAAKLECGAHEKKYGHDTLDGWQYYEVPVEKETSYKDIRVCETCGYSKMELQLIFDVNDPSKNIYEEDLWNQ